ncbi:MAG TPA: hypothetical protein VJO34_15315 [Methylomirabilota bacterium]|nr:hypothetical protein [Methylomirabilota bacterium]
MTNHRRSRRRLWWTLLIFEGGAVLHLADHQMRDASGFVLVSSLVSLPLGLWTLWLLWRGSRRGVWMTLVVGLSGVALGGIEHGWLQPKVPSTGVVWLDQLSSALTIALWLLAVVLVGGSLRELRVSRFAE